MADEARDLACVIPFESNPGGMCQGVRAAVLSIIVHDVANMVDEARDLTGVIPWHGRPQRCWV